MTGWMTWWQNLPKIANVYIRSDQMIKGSYASNLTNLKLYRLLNCSRQKSCLFPLPDAQMPDVGEVPLSVFSFLCPAASVVWPAQVHWHNIHNIYNYNKYCSTHEHCRMYAYAYVPYTGELPFLWREGRRLKTTLYAYVCAFLHQYLCLHTYQRWKSVIW